MRQHLLEKGWMSHMHHHHVVHMPHPLHWFTGHPVVLALLLAALFVLLIIWLTSVIDTGIRLNTFYGIGVPISPFRPVY